MPDSFGDPLIKYPRTFHFPWSPGATNDDRIRQDDLSIYAGERVIVTEKMDGENTTLYPDGYFHARSLDSGYHPSRRYMKTAAKCFESDIFQGLRCCGENLYAQHSIPYTSLEDYFLAFSVWKGHTCLSWDNTSDILEMAGLCRVPVLYDGLWDPDKVKTWMTGESACGGLQEGYVVRLARSFHLSEFHLAVGKYVRINHVTTSRHWMNKPLLANGLRHASFRSLAFD